jgi:uncharacterized protein YciI
VPRPRTPCSLATAAALLCCAATVAAAQPPVGMDTTYAVFLEMDPAYAGSAEASGALMGAHVQYQIGLIGQGHTMVGGPMADEPGDGPVGMTILRAPSLERARALAMADPAVEGGLLRATVRTWTTVRTGPAAATPSRPARDSVMAAVEEALRAMTASDAVASRRVMLADGVGFSIQRRPEGLRIRRESNEEYFAALENGGPRYVERLWEPTVLVHGDVASVWAWYDFHSGGRLSHCGIDAISLLRTQDGWQIATWVWTVEPDGCASNPLGALAAP